MSQVTTSDSTPPSVGTPSTGGTVNNLQPANIITRIKLMPEAMDNFISESKIIVVLPEFEQQQACVASMGFEAETAAHVVATMMQAKEHGIDLSEYPTLARIDDEIIHREKAFKKIAEYGENADTHFFVDISKQLELETLQAALDDLATLEHDLDSIEKYGTAVIVPREASKSAISLLTDMARNLFVNFKDYLLSNTQPTLHQNNHVLDQAEKDDSQQRKEAVATTNEQPSVPNREKSLDDGLVAYYPFTDGSTQDFSGNGHHGTIVGNVATSVDINGNNNQAVVFDGSSYIKGSSSGFPSTTRTVSLWFYLAASADSHPTLFAYGGNPCGTSYIMPINNRNNPGTYEVQAHCVVERLSFQYSNFPGFDWHHWAVTSDGTSTKMYIDLELVASNANPFGPTNSFSREFAIGTCVSPTTGMAPYSDINVGYFTGIIDELRIYNRALSHAEIAELFFQYHAPEPGFRENGLLAHYPFNGNARNEAQNNYHGTVFGATLTEGPVGTAYRFDGVDDDIEIPSSGALEPPQLTVSLWVKFKPNQRNTYSTLIGCHSYSTGGGGVLHGSGWVLEHLEVTQASYFIYGWNFNSMSSDWNGIGYSNTGRQLFNFADDQWRHLVFTLDSQLVTMSINGSFVSQTSTENKPFVPSNFPVRIGTLNYIPGSADPNRFLDGIVDELRIYNRALNDYEKKALYWGDVLRLFTPIPSITPSPVVSPSTSTTISPSGSITVSGSVSISQSASGSWSITSTSSPTSSQSLTPSISISPSGTITVGGSVSISQSASGSLSITSTSSPSSSQSLTPGISTSSSIIGDHNQDGKNKSNNQFNGTTIGLSVALATVVSGGLGFFASRKCRRDAQPNPQARAQVQVRVNNRFFQQTTVVGNHTEPANVPIAHATPSHLNHVPV